MIEVLSAITLIGITYVLVKLPEWKAHNRVSPHGKCTDWMQISSDRTNGMSQRDIDIKFNNGGYDIKADEYGCPDREGINPKYGGMNK